MLCRLWRAPRRIMAAGAEKAYIGSKPGETLRVWEPPSLKDDLEIMGALKAEDVYDVDEKLEIRYVQPYWNTYRMGVSDRWKGRDVVEVLGSDFIDFTEERAIESLRTGCLRVNGVVVGEDGHVLEEGDRIEHKAIRWENPVTAALPKVTFRGGPGLLAVSKPATIPVHPSGRYRFNSLLMIARIVCKLPPLWFAHRIDRPTSGLLMMADSSAGASLLSRAIADRRVVKTYLARVLGKFPGSREELGSIPFGDSMEPAVHHARDWAPEGHEDSIKKTQKDDISSGGASKTPKEAPSAAMSNLRHRPMEHVPLKDLIARYEARPTLEDQLRIRSKLAAEYRREAVERLQRACPLEGFASGVETEDGNLAVHCAAPLQTISGAVPPTYCSAEHGRPAESIFRRLSYDPDTDTSIVAARLCTGRMHQLRAHLEWLGFPIALDFFYCFDGKVYDDHSVASEELYLRALLQSPADEEPEFRVPLQQPLGILLHSFQSRSWDWESVDEDGVLHDGKEYRVLDHVPHNMSKFQFCFTADVPHWAVDQVSLHDARATAFELSKLSTKVPTDHWNDMRRAKIRAKQAAKQAKAEAKKARRALQRKDKEELE